MAECCCSFRSFVSTACLTLPFLSPALLSSTRVHAGDPLNKEAEITPVFRLNLVLEGGVVEYRPTMMDLTETISKVSNDLITCIQVVPRLEDVLPNEVGDGQR